jgi:hypothetical protein
MLHDPLSLPTYTTPVDGPQLWNLVFPFITQRLKHIFLLFIRYATNAHPHCILSVCYYLDVFSFFSLWRRYIPLCLYTIISTMTVQGYQT